MKTKPMFWLCLLAVTIFGVADLHAQSNGVTLRFSANHTCAHSALDSILIKNLSQGGSTKLYYPDTVVTFVFTDIGIVDSQFQGLYVSQNYPNPFSETTLIDVFVPAYDQLSLSVYDLSGRQVCFIKTSLDAGMHQFRFDACQKQAYLLVVNSRRHAQTRLMLQMGTGSSSQARITYEGTASGIQVKSSGSGFVFNLGDELRYTGYVTDFLGEVDYEIIADTPETDQEYLFDIANQVPQQPSEIAGETTVLGNETGLMYEVEQVHGVTYYWIVPEDWTITQGQGSHAIVVNVGVKSGDITVVAENNCGTSPERILAVTIGRLVLSGNIVSDDDANNTQIGEFHVEAASNGPMQFFLVADSHNTTDRFKITDNLLLLKDYTFIDSEIDSTYTIHVEATDGDNEWAESFVILVVGSADIEIKATTNLDPILGRPGIASDGNDFLITWLEYQAVMISRVTSAGTILDPGGNQIGLTGGYPGYASIAFDGTNYFVVWAHNEIFGVRVAPGGDILDATPIQITNGANAALRAPSITFDGENHFVAWRTNLSRVRGVRVSTEGGVLDDPSGIQIGSGFYPWVSFDENNYFIVWHKYGSGFQLDIYGNRVSRVDGSVLDGTGFEISSQNNYRQEHSSVAYDGSNYFVVWNDSRGGDAFNSGSVYGSRVSPEGQVLDPGGLELTDLAEAQVPALVIFDGSHFLVVWHVSYRAIEPTRATDIFARKVDSFGQLIDMPTPVTIAHGNQFGPVMGQSSEAVFIAWNEGEPYARGHGVWGRIIHKEIDNDSQTGTLTDIDGNVYQTVIIGDQEWMAENLRVTKYINGDGLPTGLSDTEWENTTDGATAIYPHANVDGINSDAEMVEAYGKLYNWYAVGDSRGLCPADWHVPSDEDWTQLVNYVVAQGYPNESDNPNGTGNALKSCRQENSPLGDDCDTSEHPHWDAHNTHHGFDEFGFSALPGGYRQSDESFSFLGANGLWWSSTEASSTGAWNRSIGPNGNVYRTSPTKSNGFSLRCVRDITEEPPTYNLHLDVHPQNSGIVSGAGDYEAGAQANIAAQANEGWEFVNWTGDTQYLEDDVNSPVNSIIMPDMNVSLEAIFDYVFPAVDINMLNNSQSGFTYVKAIIVLDPGVDESVRGFVWSTEESPSLEHNEGYHVDHDTGLGEFFVELTDLIPNTQYFIRAYATNSEGTAYSDQRSFHFWDYYDTVTDIDGNVYQTIIIGDQEWMAENLRVTKYNNGDTIPTELDNAEWQNATEGAYAVFDHNHSSADGINSPEEMVAAYGKLYNWYAVSDARGLCPAGWYVPSDVEWTQLVDYVVAQGFPNESDNPNGTGNALKSCRQENSPLGGDCDTSEHPYWNAHNTHHGIDEFGFSALPGGYRWVMGSFSFLSSNGLWWSSTEASSLFAWNRRIVRDGHVFRNSFNKPNGLSLRCVRTAD